MIKIAIYNDWWTPHLVGGAERSAVNNFNLLLKQGFDVTVFYPKVYSNNFQKNEIKIKSVPIFTLRKKPIASNFIKMFEKIRVFIDPISPLFFTFKISQVKPDFILLHQIDRIGPYFIPLLHLGIRKAKVIRVYHDLSDSCLVRTRFRNDKNCQDICLSCKPKNVLYKFVSKYVDFAIYNSMYTEREFNYLEYHPIKSKLGYPIVQDNNIPTELPEFKTVSNLQIGYVGRLHPTKGIEFLMRAVSKTDATLHLFGTGESKYIEQLQVLAYSLKIQTEFHGFQIDPYPVLRQLGVHILVVPSKWAEPFGRIPIEAATFGIRALVTNNGGLPESMNLIDPPMPTFDYGDEEALLTLLERCRFEIKQNIDFSIKPFPTLNSVLLEYIYSIKN